MAETTKIRRANIKSTDYAHRSELTNLRQYGEIKSIGLQPNESFGKAFASRLRSVMVIQPETIRSESQAQTTAPIIPSSSAEFVNALAHYYRGELSRMISWRDRLDRTTNWAIAGVAAMLSVSLSTPNAHHGVLLFAMLLVFLLLGIESRRYRFFHVYRSRVRLLERNYYARLFDPRDKLDPTHWMSQLAEDLRTPRFTITFSQALARRLRRNYIWILLILLLSWLLKTTILLEPKGGQAIFIHSPQELFHNAAIGSVPGWFVSIIVLSFYGWMVYVALKHRTAPGELAYGDVHV